MMSQLQAPTVEKEEQMSVVEQTTEVVAGVIREVTTHPSGDKWAVNVQPDGSQFTKNLWTKNHQMAYELSQMTGQREAFLVNVNNDPNTGKNYRWIAERGPAAAVPQAPVVQSQPGVLPPPAAPQPQQPQSVQQPQSATVTPQVIPFAGQPAVTTTSRLSDEERESRIMRQAATKVASILISHVPAEQRTLDNVLRLSEQLMGYYRNGLVMTQPAAADGDPGWGELPPEDDGIPFMHWDRDPNDDRWLRTSNLLT